MRQENLPDEPAETRRSHSVVIQRKTLRGFCLPLGTCENYLLPSVHVRLGKISIHCLLYKTMGAEDRHGGSVEVGRTKWIPWVHLPCE